MFPIPLPLPGEGVISTVLPTSSLTTTSQKRIRLRLPVDLRLPPPLFLHQVRRRSDPWATVCPRLPRPRKITSEDVRCTEFDSSTSHLSTTYFVTSPLGCVLSHS